MSVARVKTSAFAAEPGEASDLEQIVLDMAESIREVAGQYREADEAFGGQGSTVSAEYADNLESAAGELEDFQAESFDEDEAEACDRHANAQDGEARPEMCEDCQNLLDEARQTWWEGQVSAARDAVTGVSF